MKLKVLLTALLAFVAAGTRPALAIAPGSAAALTDCCTAGDADFPKVGGNLGNQNYSSLAEINQGSIRQLGAAWLNRIEGGINTGENQSTPVVVDGVIYIESAFGIHGLGTEAVIFPGAHGGFESHAPEFAVKLREVLQD